MNLWLSTVTNVGTNSAKLYVISVMVVGVPTALGTQFVENKTAHSAKPLASSAN
jgi:hypothetical protein